MQAHTEAEIRKSFVNCSKGAANRITIPKDLLDLNWEEQVFLGWIDPKSPKSGYVVTETDSGLRGFVLEKTAKKGKASAQMCQICLTLHPGSGVSLVSIPLSKSSKDNYQTMGTYLCADLACSDYTLGHKKPDGVRQMEETMSREERSERTLTNIQRLVARVAEGVAGS